MTRLLVFIVLVISLTSCRTGKPLWKVTSGGTGETFATYNNGEDVALSNVISYTVYRPERPDSIRSNRLRSIRIHGIEGIRRKPTTPSVRLMKSFVKADVLSVVINILSIIAWLPTNGKSGEMVTPVRQHDFALYQRCTRGACTGREHVIYKKILLETNIYAKDVDINGNIVTTENLPSEIKLDRYHVRKKNGKFSIESAKVEQLSNNGRDYLRMTIVPKNGRFKRNASVWIKMHVTIVPKAPPNL